MPAYRFSWEPFDDETVLALARDVGFVGEPEDARGYLTKKVVRPSDDFIRDTKETLARVWLPKHPGIGAAIVRELFDKQIGPLGQMPHDGAGYAQYVARCRNTSRLRDLLFSRLLSYGDTDRRGRDAEEGDFVPRFAILVPAKQALLSHAPYPHQEEAWSKLDERLREAGEDGDFSGVLVMPTGSGKTYTAARWLTARWIDLGRRVLWIAHREELLAQAARAFNACSGLARNQRQIRIRQVSTRSCRFHQIDPEDQIVCCSVGSLSRAGKDAEDLLHDPRLFVVIDEAHHAPAKSYRDVIEALRRAGSHRLLGLTATPTRTAEKERPLLRELFGGGEPIYQVTMGELVAKELLARPIPATVKTDVDAEKGITEEDRRHVATFHEPSAEMLERLGRDDRRNQTIARHYAANEAKYGKTLVFTTEVRGAALLADCFRKSGIRAEYVASYRPDLKEGERFDRREILREYTDPRSGLDVLINVDMLTEGVDLPITKTVFLARPTSSEILFRQMIGRALRGPRAGGNLEAHIVSFEDHWSTYFDYLSPFEWMTASEAGEDLTPRSEPTTSKPPADSAISWDAVLAIVRTLRARLGADPDAELFEAVPHGMYVLEYEADDEAIRQVIHVYDHQRPCWEALLSHLRMVGQDRHRLLIAEALDDEFFGDCDPPRPSLADVALIVERLRDGDPAPDYVELSGRADCDPRELAKLAREKDLRRSEENALLEERYTQLARLIYPTMLDFRRAFDDAMRALEHPDEATPPKGVPIFEPPSSTQLRPRLNRDLKPLFDEMLRRGAEMMGRSLPHSGSPVWTKRVIKGWFGMAWSDNACGKGRIKINVLLDSPDFSEASLLYLLWHEYLHLFLMGNGHTKEFRRLEHLWPDHLACDREMDTLNERFGVQYW